MGLKFRRGSTAQQSGSLAFGEPYVNTTLGTLVVGGPDGDIVLSSGGTGSTGNFGAISGSGLDITGNTSIGGNLTVGGKLTIGDASSDTVNVVASLSSSLIPSVNNAFDLGSPTKIWRDLYISTGSIKMMDAAGNEVSVLSSTAAGMSFDNDINVNLLTVGRGAGNQLGNTALGNGALGSNTTGNNNTFIGATAGAANITGDDNTYVGRLAGFSNHTSQGNTSVGAESMYQNTGSANTAFGFGALKRNKDGAFNIAMGYLAGQYATGSSNSNLFIGYSAGPSSDREVNHQLYIGSGETSLLRGDFQGAQLRINGTLDVRDNTVLSGSLTTVGHILPSVTNTFDLGSETKFWRDIYVSTGSIKFVGAAGTVVGTLTNVGNGLNLDAGVVANGNSSFGTSSLAVTSVTGSLRVNGSVIVTNGGISGSIAATNGVVSGSSQVDITATTGYSTFSGSIATSISASVAGATWTNISGKPAGLVSGSSQVIGILDSLNTFSGSALTRLSALEVETVNLESFSSSALTRLTALETETTNLETTTASLNTSVSNLNSFSSSQLSKDTTLGTYTGSVETRFTSLATISGSLISSASNLTQRVAANEAVSGTFARTNSTNIFTGNQTITGSLFISQDLVVGGSSSIQNISSSNLVIGAAYVTLNTATPSSRFAGLQIVDSGSVGGSGSFLYDAVQDEFIFVHRGNGINITSSHFILGPETYDNLGNETYLTNNRLPKGTGKEHLVDSNIADTGTEISLNSLTSVTGSLRVSDGIYGVINATNGVISGSSQLTATLPAGVVSGSSQLESAFEGKANSIKTIISGSSQLETAFEGRANSIKTIISGSSQLETAFEGRANSIKTIISGSTQLESAFEGRANVTKTIFSGSSQITAASTTGFATGVKTQLDANTVVSGSTQVIGILSSLNTFSGSALTRLSALEVETANLESFSSSALTRLSALEVETANLESFTSSINTTIKTRLNAETVVSSSSQISLGSASGNIALATQTTGDYVASLVASTGVTITNNSGENATPSIAIGQAVATSSNVQFNSLGIGMAASATAGRIDATNDIVAFSSSDIRFKENIKVIENPIEKIRKISGNTYDWKEENKIEHGYEGNDVGVIAQEIEAVLPQLVQTRDNGYKAVKYDKLVALLIEGIKEQQIQIDNLTLQVEELKKQKGL